MMTWEEAVRHHAKRFWDGHDEVRFRRDAWPSVRDSVILPVLEEAARVLSDAKRPCYARSMSAGAHDLVQLWTGNEPTGEVVTTQRGGTTESVTIIERPAVMTYEVHHEGLVGHWHWPHVIDGEGVREATLVDLRDPRTIDDAQVRNDVLRFLDMSLRTSFVGGQPKTSSLVKGEQRPIGFRVRRDPVLEFPDE